MSTPVEGREQKKSENRTVAGIDISEVQVESALSWLDQRFIDLRSRQARHADIDETGLRDVASDNPDVLGAATIISFNPGSVETPTHIYDSR
jgi:hypothetical protein